MSLPVMTRLDRLITTDCEQSNNVTERSNTVIQSINHSRFLQRGKSRRTEKRFVAMTVWMALEKMSTACSHALLTVDNTTTSTERNNNEISTSLNCVYNTLILFSEVSLPQWSTTLWIRPERTLKTCLRRFITRILSPAGLPAGQTSVLSLYITQR